STVVHRDNKFNLTFSDVPAETLYKNFSPFKFDDAFFYGLYRKHTFILMFDRSDGIRFSHSPSGGGDNAEVQATNPPWYFQFMIPNYEVMRDDGFHARAVFRERCSRDEIVREFTAWRKVLGERAK